MPHRTRAWKNRIGAPSLLAPLAIASLLSLPLPAAAAGPGDLAKPVEAVTGALGKTLEATLPAPPPPVPNVQVGPVRTAPSSAAPHPAPSAGPSPTPAEAPGSAAPPNYETANSEGANYAPDSPARTESPVAAIAAPVEMVVTEARSAVADRAERAGRPATGPNFREEKTPPAAASAAGTGEVAAKLNAASPGGSADGGTRAAGPIALSAWIGAGPPLPSGLVYLLVALAGSTIVVTMRRELGLHWRRRWRI